MGRNRERAGVLGLVAFLVVDALLVALAVNSTRGAVADAGATVSAGTAQTSPSTKSSTPSSTKAPRPDAAVKVVPLTVGVVGIDDKAAFRFRAGSCSKGGAELELTRNGGRTWGPRAAKFDVLTRVRVRDNGSAFAVGGSRDSDCEPTIRQTDSYDGDWGEAAVVSDAWFRDPRDTHKVGLPTGGTDEPCGSLSVIDLAVMDTGAAALCEDGAVLVSKTGDSWSRTATVKGALAVALDAEAETFLVAPGVGECEGLAVVSASAPTKVVGCVALDPATLDPGTIALSISAGPGWLVAGDQTFRADSSLKDWKKA